MRLTVLERQILKLKADRPRLSFRMVGRELGMSDSEARRHYDTALDKLRKDAA